MDARRHGARCRGPAVRVVRRYGEHAGDAPCGDGVPGEPAPGKRGHQDTGLRRRRQPEAVEAEGDRPRPRGLDPRPALGGRRHGLRAAPARLRAETSAADAPARPQERTERPGARGRDLRDRCLQLRRAEDLAAAGPARARRRARAEGPDPDGWREAERVPLGPQPAARAGDAVRRRHDLPRAMVGCGARRVRRAGTHAGTGGRAGGRADGEGREGADERQAGEAAEGRSEA